MAGSAPDCTQSPRPLHPAAWWGWATALAIAASRTTNPSCWLLLVVRPRLRGGGPAPGDAVEPRYVVFLRIASVCSVAIRVVLFTLLGSVAGVGTSVHVARRCRCRTGWPACGSAARDAREGHFAAVYDGLRLAVDPRLRRRGQHVDDARAGCSSRCQCAVRGRRRRHRRAGVRAAAGRRSSAAGARGPAAARPDRTAAAQPARPRRAGARRRPRPVGRPGRRDGRTRLRPPRRGRRLADGSPRALDARRAARRLRRHLRAARLRRAGALGAAAARSPALALAAAGFASAAAAAVAPATAGSVARAGVARCRAAASPPRRPCVVVAHADPATSRLASVDHAPADLPCWRWSVVLVGALPAWLAPPLPPGRRRGPRAGRRRRGRAGRGGGVIRFEHVASPIPTQRAGAGRRRPRRSTRASCASSSAAPARASRRCCARINGLVPHFTGGTLAGRVCRRPRHPHHPPRDLADVVGWSGRTRSPGSSPTRSRTSSPTAWRSSASPPT